MSKSIALPFAIVNGRVATTTDPTDQLTNRVFTVLATEIGERVMRPTYGADMARFDFGLGDELDRAAMQDEAQRALAKWEPNAVLSSVSFDAPPDQDGYLAAKIEYTPASGGGSVIAQVLIGVLGNGTVTESGLPAQPDVLLGGSTSSPTLAAPTSARTFGSS